MVQILRCKLWQKREFSTGQLSQIGILFLGIYFLILVIWHFKLKKDKSDLKDKYELKQQELQKRVEFIKNLQLELKNKKQPQNKKKKNKKIKGLKKKFKKKK